MEFPPLRSREPSADFAARPAMVLPSDFLPPMTELTRLVVTEVVTEEAALVTARSMVFLLF